MLPNAGAILPPKYDPLDPAVMENPYPTYARLRESGPLCRGGPGQWVVTRYADVVSLLRDARLGNQFPEAYRQFSFGDTEARTFFERIILNRDPPDHTRLRRLMGAAFSPALIHKLTAHIGDLVDGLLAAITDLGRCDAVADLAFTLPVMVVCELIGIPASDRDEVRPRAADLCKAFGTRLPNEDRAVVNNALVWLRRYIGRLVDERTGRNGEDLLSGMLAAAGAEEKLTREEIVDNALFLLFAGFETTMNLISAGCEALARNPDQFMRLRDNPALIPLAVEEFLRYDAPIQTVGRMVLEPVEVGGRIIRRDRVLILLLGSANHDDRVFKKPEQLDITRNPNPHLSFSGGVHFCLGATLARVEAGVVFGRICERFVSLEPVAAPVRLPSAAFRSWASVPLAFKAR
jgi:cytochrome P450